MMLWVGSRWIGTSRPSRVRSVTGAEPDVLRAFNPASIAVIGASSRPGALSWWPVHLLATNGYTGKVFPINPTREEIEGLRCYRSIAAVPGPVDLALIALNAEKTFEAVRDCAAAGVPTVVLPTQGFGETSAAGAAIQRSIAEFAREHGMRIIGPNTDGIANLATGAIASIQPLFETGIEPGPVGLATQSGATASSLVLRLKQAGIGCKLYASAGNEVDLGLVDYLSVMIQDPDIRILLSFVETLRRPAQFLEVASLAAELGKPIVLIKVGRSEGGARRAAAHTGALAGSDQLYEAMFRSCGVIRVSELSEMVAVAKLFLSRGAPSTPGVGIISVSGGQAGALADKASEMGLPVPALSRDADEQLSAVLKFGKGFNPCDLTGEIATNPALAAGAYESFDSEPAIGTVIYARKHLTANAGVTAGRMLGERASLPEATPLAIYAMDGTVWGKEADIYKSAAIPVFDNLHDLYTAVDRLSRWSASRRKARRCDPPTPKSGHAYRGVVPELDAKRMLIDAGVPLVAERFAADRDAAVAAAAAIGYPVVLKVVSERIAHKTEAGGVALDLRDAKAVAEAFDRLRANARTYLVGGECDGVIVQEQIVGATEVILGIKVDPALGPFIVVGLGGIFTELLQDVSVRPAPVDPETAREMIRELRGAKLFDGFRGASPRDVQACVEAIVHFSVFAAEQRSWLAEADLNPLLVLEENRGVRAVDVLLVGTQ
jgi:acyl-CoA synthetase (NDP forming)